MEKLNKEVTVRHTLDETLRIVNYLRDNNIECRYSLNGRNEMWIGRGTIRSYLGSVGVKEESNKTYYIFVSKDDFECAQHLLSRFIGG